MKLHAQEQAGIIETVRTSTCIKKNISTHDVEEKKMNVLQGEYKEVMSGAVY